MPKTASLRLSVLTAAALTLGVAEASAQALDPFISQQLQAAASRNSQVDLTTAVIQGIAFKPQQTNAIVATAVALAPQYSQAIVASASNAFPGFAPTIQAAAGTPGLVPVQTGQQFGNVQPQQPRQVRSPRSSRDGKWSGQVEVGGALATGNTDTTEIYAAGDLGYEVGNWEADAYAEYAFSDSNGATTEKRVKAGLAGRYSFSSQLYAFGSVDWLDDSFSAYDYDIDVASGVGYRVYDSDDLSWSVEAGPAVRFSRLRAVGATPGSDSTDFIGYVGSDFSWAATDYLTITNVGTATVGSRIVLDDTTAAKAKIAEDWSLQLSFNVRYSTDQPVGFKKLDTRSRAAIVYEFGG